MSDNPTAMAPAIPNNTYIAAATVDTLNHVYDSLSFLRDSLMTSGHGESITFEYAARQGLIIQLHSALAAIDYEVQRLQHHD